MMKSEWQRVTGVISSNSFTLVTKTTFKLHAISPFLNQMWSFWSPRPHSPVGWVTSFVVMMAPLLLTTMMGEELLLDKDAEGLGRILLGCTCWVMIFTPAHKPHINKQRGRITIFTFWTDSLSCFVSFQTAVRHMKIDMSLLQTARG